MLICFGAAWPFSIYKSYLSGSNKGKSLFFLVIVEIGYFSGILHKAFYNYDQVIYLYLINFFLVLIDLLLYGRNKILDKKNTRQHAAAKVINLTQDQPGN